MNIFKSFTMKWWQVVIFKVSIVALGVVIGAYWNQIFSPFIIPLIITALVCGVYVCYIWWKQ